MASKHANAILVVEVELSLQGIAPLLLNGSAYRTLRRAPKWQTAPRGAQGFSEALYQILPRRQSPSLSRRTG